MPRPSPLVWFYAGAAAVGAVVPYAILLPWARVNGFDPGVFFALPFATAPAALFSADLLISASVFLVFATVEARRVGVPGWIAPLATLVFGMCCALPLFLALREARLKRMTI